MMAHSDNIRRYYWGVVIPEASKALIDAGWEREFFSHINITHDFFKNILNTPTTTDLNNKQFLDYIEDIKRICAVYLHYSIPDPNE